MDGENEATYEVEPPQEVSEPYLVAMYEDDAIYVFPGGDERYFFTAKHPGLDEDRIKAAMAPGAALRRVGKGNEMDADIRMVQSTEAGFVEKCIRQITNYRFMAAERDDKGNVRKVEREFRPGARGSGDTEFNRETYTAWLKSKLRSEMEEVLDRVACRTDDAQEDMTALGEGLGM